MVCITEKSKKLLCKRTLKLKLGRAYHECRAAERRGISLQAGARGNGCGRLVLVDAMVMWCVFSVVIKLSLILSYLTHSLTFSIRVTGASRNTGIEAGIHPGWEASPSQGTMHTRTHMHTHIGAIYPSQSTCWHGRKPENPEESHADMGRPSKNPHRQ